MKTYYVDQFVKITHEVKASNPHEAQRIVSESLNDYAIEFDTQEYVVEEKQDA